MKRQPKDLEAPDDGSQAASPKKRWCAKHAPALALIGVGIVALCIALPLLQKDPIDPELADVDNTPGPSTQGQGDNNSMETQRQLDLSDSNNMISDTLSNVNLEEAGLEGLLKVHLKHADNLPEIHLPTEIGQVPKRIDSRGNEKCKQDTAGHKHELMHQLQLDPTIRAPPIRGGRTPTQAQLREFEENRETAPHKDVTAVIELAKQDPVHSRCMATMIGMAVGDFVGAPLEFTNVVDKPSYPGAKRETTGGFSLSETRGLSWVGDGTLPDNLGDKHEKKPDYLLMPGEWTDDASMGLCIAESLILKQGYDGSDIRKRFWLWWHRGYNNAFTSQLDPRGPRHEYQRIRKHRLDAKPGLSVGLHSTWPVSSAITDVHQHFVATGEAHPTPNYEADGEDTSNSPITRLAAIPVFFSSWDIHDALNFAEQSSLTTHPGVPHNGSEVAFCARLMTYIIIKAITRPSDDCSDPRGFLVETIAAYRQDDAKWLAVAFTDEPLPGRPGGRRQLFNALLDGTKRGVKGIKGDYDGRRVRNRYAIWAWREVANPASMLWARDGGDQASGERKNDRFPVNEKGGLLVHFDYFGSYCVDALAIALHGLYTTKDFNTGLAKVVNFRGDADATGSIFGQLAGAYYGHDGIHPLLLQTLQNKDGGKFAFLATLLRQEGENVLEIRKNISEFGSSDFGSSVTMSLASGLSSRMSAADSETEF